MKKVLFFIFMSSFALLKSQELTENKVDEFTKNTVKRSSWELFNKGSFSANSFRSFFRLSQINDAIYLDIKMMPIGGGVYSISKGAKLMFKIDTGQIISVENLEYSLSCRGCGARGFAGSEAMGTQTSYRISKEDLLFLKTKLIHKIRIYTNDGYMEDEVSDKVRELLVGTIKLFDI